MCIKALGGSRFGPAVVRADLAQIDHLVGILNGAGAQAGAGWGFAAKSILPVIVIVAATPALAATFATTDAWRS